MLFHKRQYLILSERYFECLLGDFSYLVWMIGQAPLIASLIILRWQSSPATETLHFVLALSSVWFGCINACREIAKETPVYKRERLFGLNRLAYLLSKVKILTMIGLIEIGLFFILLDRNVDLGLSSLACFLTLLVCYFSGMSMGLFLSRWCSTPSKAVTAVPIAVIPQIIFSKFVLPLETLKGFAAKIEKLMLVKWGFEAFRNSLSHEFIFGKYFYSIFFLFILGVIFLVLTWGHLVLVDE